MIATPLKGEMSQGSMRALGRGSNAASGRGSPRVWPAQRTWVGVVSERRHSEAPEDKSKKVRWRRAAVWLPAEFHKEKRPEAGEVKWRTHSKRAGGRTRLSRDLLAFLGLAASWAWLPYRLRGSYPSPRRSLLGPKFQPLLGLLRVQIKPTLPVARS
jgi:hypothetical protein